MSMLPIVDRVLTYRGSSLTRKRTPLGPYRRPMPRVLGGSQVGGNSLMGAVPLYALDSCIEFSDP